MKGLFQTIFVIFEITNRSETIGYYLPACRQPAAVLQFAMVCRNTGIRTLAVLLLIITACSRQPVFPSPAVSGNNAVIDIAGLKPDVPQFFTYQYESRNISFFVIKLDQKIISFLDACASCYPHKQGYRYDDGSVICRFCNMKFSVYKLEKGLGGCYPIKIEGRMEKDKYRIPLALLQAESGKF